MAFPYLLAAILAAFIYIIRRRYNDPLNSFPGPYLASWTNAWRFCDATSGMHRSTSLLDLHREYGDVVRIGPNVLSFAHPQAVKDIYGTDKPYGKSGLYWTAAAVSRGEPSPSLFSSLDGAWHDNLRRAVNPAFSLSALVQYEPFVNNTIASFLQQLSTRFADKPGADGLVDLPTWLQWYAFDVIGELTYGAPFGFLQTASDIDGITGNAHWYNVYVQVVGTMPWLDKLLLKNPVLLSLNRRGYFTFKPNPVVSWTLRHQASRQDGKRVSEDGDRLDLLDKFLQAKEKHPDSISDREVLGLGISMVLAGSETTAITLTAIFYYLLKNPKAYKKLQAEVDEAFAEVPRGNAVPFQAAQKLPYLDACIKEAFRMHPAARFAAERVLPAKGAIVAGLDIPGGTVVGVNAWPLHRREEIFGQDVETYKPERWLTESEGDQARVAAMGRMLFQFGAGRFVCIGKNISLLEIYKAVPSLLRTFDFALDAPEKMWRFESGSFANVSGVNVRINSRAK